MPLIDKRTIIKNEIDYEKLAQTIVSRDIDYDKLADAIVEANDRIRLKEEKAEIKQHEQLRQEWQNVLGYKEYPKDEGVFKRKIHEIRNDFCILKSAIFFKEEDVQNTNVLYSLLNSVTASIFAVCEIVVYIITLLLLIMPFILKSCYFLFSLAFLSFIYARLIRIAKLEVKQIKSIDKLNNIFSAMMTFIATVLAAIALFVR